MLLLAAVTLIYAATTLVNGSGFLAVYIAGIIIGNSRVIHKRSLTRFSDSLAWLMQILMFLTLGLLVFPSRLVGVAGIGLAVSAFLLFVARPLAVFSVLAFTKLNIQQKLLISWVGLRGAVPIVVATIPLLAGVQGADNLFNIVFFVVLSSTLLQGTSIPLVARWLGVGAPYLDISAPPLELNVENVDSELVELVIPPHSSADGKLILQLGFPAGTLVVLIERNNHYIVPTGNTALAAGDILTVLGHKDHIHEARNILRGSGVGQQQN